ncbi:hypothetical protein M501DRAFT_1030239 [Patellaria atrata CBS 101060]|uniref:Secreted protein n=1 Tax=Patellaria atrata CBS 101060 TaxID=1346257 RepID=A0A9P4SFX4_9PEZI|nr:hypothetical protein M501DRAFT_1030239 [Patellaria atrata CBS 101060]
MRSSFFVAVAAFAIERASASLNCTALVDIDYYTCPDTNCDKAGTYKAGTMAQFGCAWDNSTATNRWLWNYNEFYTASTYEVKDCNLNGRPYNNTDVLPKCSQDIIVLEITNNAPLKPCVCHRNQSAVSRVMRRQMQKKSAPVPIQY